MTTLGLTDLEPVRLQLRQPAARLADAAGDPLREVDVIGIEVDVVGDQERASTDRYGACGRMHPMRSEVRLAAVLLDLDLEALVLPPADVGEALAVGPQGGSRVEVHRQAEAGRHAAHRRRARGR